MVASVSTTGFIALLGRVLMNSFADVYSFLRPRLFGLFAATALLSLAGCGKPVASAPAAAAAKSVSTATAVAKDVPIYLDADGQTTAYQSVNIVSQVEGQIVEMPFEFRRGAGGSANRQCQGRLQSKRKAPKILRGQCRGPNF